MRSAIILITTSFLFFFSCKDEDPIENPDFPGGCDHQLGTFSLLETSLPAKPYQGISKVIFKDSLGNELIFLANHEEEFPGPITLIKDDTTTNSRIRYCYYRDYQKTTLSNDSLGIRIFATLQAQLNYEYPFLGYFSDRLSISMNQDFFGFTLNLGGVFKTIHQRTNPSVTVAAGLDSLICHDTVFYNVEYNPNFFGNEIHVYTSHGLGVIFFEDRDEKRWRFKRME